MHIYYTIVIYHPYHIRYVTQIFMKKFSFFVELSGTKCKLKCLALKELGYGDEGGWIQCNNIPPQSVPFPIQIQNSETVRK